VFEDGVGYGRERGRQDEGGHARVCGGVQECR